MNETVIKDLKNKTRLLITHTIKYLKKADKIVYIDEGEVKFVGNYESFSSEYKEIL